MRLKRLRIGEFKNLKDIEITFAHPYTVLVGQNGSGKSNIYEALVLIFDSLECKRVAPFKYELEYDCRDWHIRVDSDPGREGQKTLFFVDAPGVDDADRPLTPGHFHRWARDPKGGLLPELVFGYYSGFCDRFKKPFEKYRRSYTRRVRDLDQEQVPSRRFLYGSLRYADLLMVALYAHQLRDGGRSAVLDALGIDGVINVDLALQPPPGYNREKHDPRGMGLKGLTREFMGHLDFFAPSENVPGDLKETHVQFSDPGLTSLAEFAAKRGTNLFNVLLQAQEEGVLPSLNCTLALKSGQQITYDDLSEGEKQLLLVMGMMRFAEHAEALFLLDEPDTHLNPRWSLDYIGTISKEFGHQPKSHIIMATHDPLVLTELDAPEVQILARDEETGRVTVTPCPYPPKEMGVDGLLTSPLFGLRAPIGKKVQDLINERATLLAKGADADTARIREITKRLDGMGFANVFADPIYNRFVAAMGKRPEFMKPVLTPEEMVEQERFAERILSDIMSDDPRQALARAETALTENRALARRDRATHLPDLARSLRDTAEALATAGRRSEAGEYRREAALIFRELLGVDRDAFLLETAGVLSDMAEDLASCGNQRGVIQCAEEAITLYRELAAIRPQAFPRNVVVALDVLARGLTDARASGALEEGNKRVLAGLASLRSRQERGAGQ